MSGTTGTTGTVRVLQRWTGVDAVFLLSSIDCTVHSRDQSLAASSKRIASELACRHTMLSPASRHASDSGSANSRRRVGNAMAVKHTNTQINPASGPGNSKNTLAMRMLDCCVVKEASIWCSAGRSRDPVCQTEYTEQVAALHVIATRRHHISSAHSTPETPGCAPTRCSSSVPTCLAAPVLAPGGVRCQCSPSTPTVRERCPRASPRAHSLHRSPPAPASAMTEDAASASIRSSQGSARRAPKNVSMPPALAPAPPHAVTCKSAADAPGTCSRSSSSRR